MPRPSVVTSVRFLFARGRLEAAAFPVGQGHLPRVWPGPVGVAEQRSDLSTAGELVRTAEACFLVTVYTPHGRSTPARALAH